MFDNIYMSTRIFDAGRNKNLEGGGGDKETSMKE
jgi:hypothetical protein